MPMIRSSQIGPYAQEWSAAIASERNSHEENNTWTLVDVPENQRIIGSMWVFRVLYDLQLEDQSVAEKHD